MAKTKTTATDANVIAFIDAFAATPQRLADGRQLLDWMTAVTGLEAYMWGPSIVGFGSYHYKYASGHEGDAPLVGFSPRKAAMSLYVFTGLPEHEHLLEGLGKFKMGKACIYVSKQSDIDLDKLRLLVTTSIAYLQQKYGQN